MTEPIQSDQIYRAKGVTPAERYLKRLCDRTFLSLWSYASIYRDQGITRGGHGKEVCDTLVVFENHVIIFSDKDCAFPDTGDLQVDWSRWFKRAVLKSAEQVYGAERWIREYPDRLFLDPECTKPFPFPLPDPREAKFHRIVVAHNESDRCQTILGGSGSLMIHTDIVGIQHVKTSDNDCLPFAVGHINPSKGFVHVLDDTTLEIVMGTLDTISDFVNYLMKKERFLTGNMTILVPGEEDLLALYLRDVNEQGEHDFVLPDNVSVDIDMLVLDEDGSWENFVIRLERHRQLQAEQISYFWDDLIESTTGHKVEGTQHYTADPSIPYGEQLLRMLARESRFRRRLLSRSLLDLSKKTPENIRNLRIMSPLEPVDPYYVFLMFPEHENVSYEHYRLVRRDYLYACLLIAKLTFPDALDIVGLTSESGTTLDRSEDIIYLDARQWTDSKQKEALRLQRELDILNQPEIYRLHDEEYPSGLPEITPMKATEYKRPLRGAARNMPCPCGSGMKYKKCCGRPWRLVNK